MTHATRGEQGAWPRHATQWNWVGPPLRPSPEDIRCAEAAIQCWYEARRPRAPRALLLGVTPELASMRWPPGTRLLAVDHAPAMIRAVWPGTDPARSAVCGRWQSLPLPAGSQHLVVGDGSLNVLQRQEDHRVVARAVRRVLDDDGLLVLRVFVRPPAPESPEAVLADLVDGRIGNFHVFKWRLVMALHPDLAQGVRLAQVWDVWHAAVPDADALAARLGWRPEVVRTIDAYRGLGTRYTFPTLDEARALLAGEFVEEDCRVPGYELGERCPTLVLRPR